MIMVAVSFQDPQVERIKHEAITPRDCLLLLGNCFSSSDFLELHGPG